MTNAPTTTTPTMTRAEARDRAPSLVSGFNHVAVVTADLDRLVGFYIDTFDAEFLEVPAPPGTRSGTVLLTESAGLVVMEMPANPHVAGSAAMLDRGHLDHLALEAPTPAVLDELRRRLVAAGASDGTISDYGPMLSVYFTDPDGMASEVCWVRDRSFAGFHAPEVFAGSLAGEGPAS